MLPTDEEAKAYEKKMEEPSLFSVIKESAGYFLV